MRASPAYNKHWEGKIKYHQIIIFCCCFVAGCNAALMVIAVCIQYRSTAVLYVGWTLVIK